MQKKTPTTPLLASAWPRRCPKCGSRLQRDVANVTTGSTINAARGGGYLIGMVAGWHCWCGFWEDVDKPIHLTPELEDIIRGAVAAPPPKDPAIYTKAGPGGRLSKAARAAVAKYRDDIDRMLKKKTAWKTIAKLLRQITGGRFHHETLRRYYLLRQQERGV